MILQGIITEGIANGTVRPISRIEFSPIEISRAFRLLSSNRNVGKVLIKMRSPEILKEGFDVIPRINYNSSGVYIVVCDENDIGIELADRLVKNGARKIVLHSRSKISGYWQTKFVSWAKHNVTVKISTDNLQTQDGCTKMLKEASKTGSVKGIFIVPDFEDEKDENAVDFVPMFNKTALAVINLDLTSKNYCNELSHFVILSKASQSASSEFSFSVMEGICQARNKSGFPALIIRPDSVSQPDKITNLSKITTDRQTLAVFFDAMENSLKLKYNNVLTCDVKKENSSDYELKLARILGVAKIENIQNETIVNDLTLNEANLMELQTLIRNIHKVDYPVEKIQNMTIESLKNIGNDITAKPKNHFGLGAFYTNIDDEEEHLATSHPVVPMETLLSNGMENTLDPTETYLTLIPGFEGRHQIFNSMAERLKVLAVAVQLAPDIEGNSIPEIAASVRKFMKTKFEIKSKFYLLGYSFGVNVALELAALLEKEGYTGLVYCLDSSPDALRIQLKSHLGELTDSELQTVVLEHLFQLMTGRVSEELTQNLEQTKDWKEKVDACLHAMRKLENYSIQYKRSILESAYKRILLARNYEPDFKLNSELVLIKGLPHPKADNLPEDYSLSKYTTKPVKIFNIESDHASVPYDCKISNIVNKMLDKTLLEEFKKKNLCETYFIRSTK